MKPWREKLQKTERIEAQRNRCTALWTTVSGHGYEIAQLIEVRSDGRLKFQAATLYPLLYKLEKRGLVEGRWVEKPGQRRRRFYRLTSVGRAALGERRRVWREFFDALEQVALVKHA